MFSPIVQNKGCLTAPGKASQGKGISASAHRSFQVYIYLSASAPTGFALNARNRALGFLGVATAGRRAILRGMQRWFFVRMSVPPARVLPRSERPWARGQVQRTTEPGGGRVSSSPATFLTRSPPLPPSLLFREGRAVHCCFGPCQPDGRGPCWCS